MFFVYSVLGFPWHFLFFLFFLVLGFPGIFALVLGVSMVSVHVFRFGVSLDSFWVPFFLSEVHTAASRACRRVTCSSGRGYMGGGAICIYIYIYIKIHIYIYTYTCR